MSTVTADPTSSLTTLRKELEPYTIVSALPDRITSQETAEAVIGMVADVEARIRQIEARIADPKKRAHAVWKDWIALENEMTKIGRDFAQRGRDLLNAYASEQRRLAEQEAQDRARKEREEAEARALADAQALEALAQETGDETFAQLADSVIENVPDVVDETPAAPVKLAGARATTTRQTLAVVNVRLLCAEIAAGRVPDSVIKDLHMKALTDHVKKTGRVPAGVEWRDDTKVQIGRKG